MWILKDLEAFRSAAADYKWLNTAHPPSLVSVSAVSSPSYKLVFGDGYDRHRAMVLVKCTVLKLKYTYTGPLIPVEY